MDFDLREEYDKIYRYCYHRLGHAQAAEDATQETFLKYFAQTTYVSRGKPLAYLYTIARNLCIDTARRPYLSPLPLPENESAAGLWGEEPQRLETVIAVRTALQTLPQQQQELLLLRYANELRLGEISSITGLSRFAIARKLKSALAQLRPLLKDEP